jgi:Tfp pilus assembly protein PilN
MSDVNLIPAGRLEAKRRKARLCVWAVACGVYGILVAGGSLTFHVAQAGESRSQTQQLERADEQIKVQTQDLAVLRRRLAEAMMALETTQAVRGQPDWSKLLVGLSTQLGEEMVLNRFQLTTLTADNRVIAVEGGAVPAGPLGTFLNGCRHTLVLNGYGKSQEAVSRFVLRLEGSGVFDLVRLVNSSRQTFLKGEAVAFVVECHF